LAIRKILFALAAIVVLVGASQLVFASWWLVKSRDAVDSSHFYLFGLTGVVFGLLVLIAVMEKAVGLRLFMAAIALLTMASGALVLANPAMMRGFAYSGIFDRSPEFQVLAIRLAGGLRVAIGIVMLAALFRASSPKPTAEVTEAPDGTEPPRKSYS